MPKFSRVVLATPSWSLNGPNVFSANLARGLRALGAEAEILVTRPDWTDRKPLPVPTDIPFSTLEGARFRSYAARCEAMVQYLESCAPCVYVPNYDYGHSCVSSVLSDGVAIAGIIHSDDPEHYDHVVRLGPSWNAVVAVSSAIAEEVVRLQPEVAPRLSTIPYGVAMAPVFPERLRSAGEPLRLVYTGRLDEPQKRVLDLPRIVAAARNVGVPVHLTIVGSGPAEAELRASCAALGVDSLVTFRGTLDRAALAAVLAESDVFVLASAFEGLPISVLEAMGQGCVPVVTDLRSGIRELVRDGGNGFRVGVGDLNSFADRLQMLYEDSALQSRVARAAYASVGSGGYSVERMANSYLRLFERITSTPFQRRRGPLTVPPGLPWQEQLPGFIQQAGHSVKQLFGSGRG